MGFLDAVCSGIHTVAQLYGVDESVGRMSLCGHRLDLQKGNGEYLGSVNDVRSVLGCGQEGVVVLHSDGSYAFYDMHGKLKGGLLSREEYFAVKDKMPGFFDKPSVHPE